MGKFEKKKSAEPKPEKSKGFRTGLIIYVSVLAAVCAVALTVLWQYLARFQKEVDAETARQEAILAQQEYEKAVYRAPQRAFEAWQEGFSADDWTDLWYAAAENDLDSREQVSAYMAQRFATVQAYKSADFTQEAPVYVLKGGEEALARITLSGSELDWRVSDVELLMEGTHTASVLAPEGCRVLCNGRELGERYRGESAGYFPYAPLAERLENPITWACFTVEDLLLEPELTVEAPEGFGLTRDPDGRYLLCLEGDTSTYTDRSVRFVRAYLNYYMSGERNTQGNLNSALSYLTPGTQAYQELSETYIGVIWNSAYSNIDTSKTTAGDVIVWADNCYSVDVTYNADATMNGQAVDYADATMRIYFLRRGSGFIISNFEVL